MKVFLPFPMDFNSLSLFNEFSQVSVLSQLTVSVISFGLLGAGVEIVLEVVEVEVVVVRVVF